MRKIALRYLLIICGFVSVLLGLLGIILPLLPTTPFLILALACFSRSSTRFHRLLLNAPYVGQDLRNWEKEKKIDRKRKKHIYLIIIVSFCISILVLYGRPLLQVMLFSIMWILLYFIYSIDEK
ncbi:MAG: YbaN family protein [Psychromonas sp.]